MESNSVNGQRGSELLSSLAAIVDDEARQGVKALGERVSTRVALEWGGQQLYLPFDRVRRNSRIYALFNGHNYHELGRRFKMSERGIQRIIADERARRRHRQAMLPGVGTGGDV